MDPKDLSFIRNEYRRGELDETHIHPDPVVQFNTWMEQAIMAGIEEPTAMTLATATTDGIPSARMVLLKGADRRGFVFFTNYRSRKGKELDANPAAALVFFWKELERQVRIEGKVFRLSTDESNEYFSSRPEESQVNAIISPQSEIISSREKLLDLREYYLKNHSGPHIRPEHWGGFCLVPSAIEFWQGRPGRLHDRILYSASGIIWKIKRLAP
jgi:pyridoxamine 5'-phosphate oxidase